MQSEASLKVIVTDPVPPWMRESIPIPTRVFHCCPFLDAILGNLAKYVDGQYKVNAKKIRFLSHEMSRRHNVAFFGDFLAKTPRVAIF